MSNSVHAIIKVFVVFFALINTAIAANKYSIANGNWTSGTTWSNTSGGASCNCSPLKSDNIYISNNVTLDKDLTGGAQGLTGILTINSGASLNGAGTYSLELRSGSTFTVNGSLTIKDLTLNSGSNILFQTGATAVVNGTFLNKTGSTNVTVNGTLTVNGTFSNNASGIIGGSGSILINTGPAINGGSAAVFGISAASPCSSFPCTLPVPLPIELIAFSASRNGYSVEMKWSTVTETNNDYFTIERSRDLMDWDEVAKIKGAGNSAQEQHYTCKDNNPVITDCYYRLRQTDFDGHYQWFDAIFVAGIQDYRMRLFPNPASDNKVSVNLLQNDMNTAIIKVYDMTGAEVKAKISQDWNSAVMHIEIDADAVKAARMFFVTLIGGDKVLREKLVIN
jgi:hypothetical protein